MGRPKGVIRRIADETSLDQATARRLLAAADMTEPDCEADFARAVEIVRQLADNDRVIGHAVNGRGQGGANGEYAAAKADEMRYRAEKMRLDNERKRGNLIDRAAATETITRILGDLRATLLAMGGKLAPALVGQADGRAIAKLIDNEVRDTLTELADESKFAEALDKEALS
ncbi:hypothetical protein [Bradyrhizobium sp. USDA 3256]